jgi:hypothetical protein
MLSLKKSEIEKESVSWHYLILPFLFFAITYPYLKTGYYFDDSINASFWSSIHRSFNEYWQVVCDRLRIWTFQERRFFPLAIVSLASVFYFLKNLLLYRTFQVGMTVLNLVLYTYWLESLNCSRWFATLSALLACSFFQLRNYHDPLSSYAALLQISFLFGLSSAVLLNYFQKSSKIRYLFLSYFFYGCALLNYELNIIFLPLILLQCSSQKKWQIRSGYLLLTAAYICITLCLRLTSNIHYSGVSVSVGLLSLKTYLWQLSAALPLSYPIFGRSDFVKFKTILGSEVISFQSLMLLLSFSGLFYFYIKKSLKTESTANSRQVSRMGLILLFIPPAFVALSEKYQHEISRPGHGYLPVYYSYFGMSLLLGLWITQRRTLKRIIPISLCLAAAATLNFTLNQITASGLNRFWKTPRLLVEDSFKDGILTPLCRSSQIVNGSYSYYWFDSHFITGQCGHAVEIKPSPLLEAGKAQKDSLYLKFGSISESLGWVLVTSFSQTQNRQFSFSGPLRIWIHSENLSVAQTLRIYVDSKIIPLSELTLREKPPLLHWHELEVPIQVDDLNTLDIK